MANALKDVPNRPAVLLKDFVEDEYQLLQGRAAGADTALLIVARLSAARLTELIAFSRSLGMEPLVEAANAQEMKTALASGALFIGINNRDLHTFTVDSKRTVDLMALIPQIYQHHGGCIQDKRDQVTVAALSGIKTREDVKVYEQVGAKAILVGETLMKAPDVVAKVQELVGCDPTRQHATPLVKKPRLE